MRTAQLEEACPPAFCLLPSVFWRDRLYSVARKSYYSDRQSLVISLPVINISQSASRWSLAAAIDLEKKIAVGSGTAAIEPENVLLKDYI